MKIAGKGIKRLIAFGMAAALVASPLLSRTVQADETLYKAWKVAKGGSTDPSKPVGFFIKQQDDENAEEMIAYCLNATDQMPDELSVVDNTATQPKDRSINYRKKTVDQSNIYSVIGDKKQTAEETPEKGEAVRRNLLSVLRDGYRGPGKTSVHSSTLTDERVYWAVTQLAVWHYTNGKNPDNLDEIAAEFALEWVLPEDDLNPQPLWQYMKETDETARQTLRIAFSPEEEQLLNQIEEGVKVYQALVSASLSTEEAARYVLDVFVKSGKNSKSQEYQNLANFNIVSEQQKKPVVLSKQEAGGGSELPGATLRLFIVDTLSGTATLVENGEWISGTQPTTFEVYPGATYRLEETQAPENYVLPDPQKLRTEWIEFRVDANGQATLTNGSSLGAEKNGVIVMYNNKKPNTPVTFSKTALGQGAELPGATIEVWKTDENGNPAGTAAWKSWVSTGQAHVIDEVFEGYYLMREIRTPYGYEIAEDVRFHVTEQATLEVYGPNGWSTEQHVLMEDAESPHCPVKFLKVKKEDGQPLAGAVLQVKYGDTVVKEWTSTGQPEVIELPEVFTDEDGDRKDDTDYTEYTFVEKTAPAGYLKTNETVTFRVTRTTDASGNVSAVVQTKDAAGNWTDAGDTLVFELANEKEPGNPGTPPSNPPTPPGNPPSNPPTNPGTPTTPTTPVTPTTNTPATPGVLGAQRTQPEDGQQAVLGARRTGVQTSDASPVKLLLVVMSLAGAGLIMAVAQWTKPQKARRCPKNRALKRKIVRNR
ncbi:MAG: Cys-Gln thioester bond-forming surface protein [Lachnospiraceae bacterium]|nr:Cys-Gln thioester bond-forming surface protein [Lachnospiraceae bacterium]